MQPGPRLSAAKHRTIMVCTCKTWDSPDPCHHASPTATTMKGERAVKTLHPFPNTSPTLRDAEVLTRPPTLPLCTHTAPEDEKDFTSLQRHHGGKGPHDDRPCATGVTANTAVLKAHCSGLTLSPHHPCPASPSVSRTPVPALPGIRCRRGLQTEGRGQGMARGPGDERGLAGGHS